MKDHLSHLKYTLMHKWFVLVAGGMNGVPLWRLIIHDWSKFTPREWTPYVKHFFNPDGTRRKVHRKDGGYDPNAQDISFRKAWLAHQRNPHHWQAWISIGDNGSLEPLPMPDHFVLEMVSDWMGAGRAYTGKWDIYEWYEANKDKMVLHPETRQRVNNLINGDKDELQNR